MKTALILLAILGLAAGAQTVQQFINDNHALNYALTLENFEAALYASGSSFQESDYTAAGFPAGTKAAIDFIGGVEAGHATTLAGVLAARGWPAVPACTGQYNFGYSNITQFVNLLFVVEAVGTGAYDGAATAITDKTLLTVAAGIATVEARHTAILATIVNKGFNGSFTPNLNQFAATTATGFDATISLVTPFFTAAAGGFINCPAATLNTSYAGNVTVQSTNFTSYRWSTANSLRGLNEDLAGFYLGPNNVNATVAANDLSILQYALALENFEASFYANFSALYSVSAIQAAATAAGITISNADAQLISDNIALIGAHEALHAAFISANLRALGATPGTACNYTTGLNSSSTFTQFLTLAGAIENVGVQAYVGAISFIANSQLSTAAAAIATVEGEHAAYVNNLVQNAGFAFLPKPTVAGVANAAVDSGATPAVILSAQGAGPFLAQCTAAQLGTPAPISGTSFVNFFNDQNVNSAQPFPTTSSTTAATTSATTSSAGARSTTSTSARASGSASGLVACAAVVVAALVASF